MGSFEIESSGEAAKQYKKLPKEYNRPVDIAFSRLSEGLQLDLKPVEGEKEVYRVGVGRYRVLLTKLDDVILVFKISPRGDVYKR